MDKLYDYIDEHNDEYLDLLKAFCNQPSISTQNVGMDKMMEMVKKELNAVGADIKQLDTSGYPIIYGEIDNGRERTITFYNHYDVQPVEPVSEWDSDPFDATVRDGKIYARGAADNKGSMLSRICAVKAYQQVWGELPVNVKFIIEGEEEVGSPHLKEFSEKYPDKLKTDGIVWEGGGKNVNRGPLQVILGVKGLLYVELRAKGASCDLHSENAAIIKNPAWRLVWALASLKNERDEITVDGFYDSVKKPSKEDMKYLDELVYEEELMLNSRGVTSFINNLTGTALKEKFLYQPALNICGIQSGYTLEGSKTVLPSTAVVKMDFRLVYDQKPEEVLNLLRIHLHKRGFDDIEIVPMGMKNPYWTAADSALARTVINNVEKIYGQKPVVYRSIAGTTSMYDLCQDTNIPAVMYGVDHDESQIHGPNENIYIDDYINGIKLTATVLREFAQTK